VLPSSQKNIDSTLTPNSFLVTDKQLKITEVMFKEEKILNNVAGYIEGSDRVMKNEIVVFSGHYDHIGVNGTKVNPGADDDASGCAALLSTAEDPMTGPNGVFVITDNQSRELIDIANEIDKKSILKNLSW